MTFKAIIFDLDGTLIDSLEDLGDATNRILKRNNFPVHTLETYKSFVGEGVTKLITRALPPEKRSEGIISLCVKAFREDYRKNWNVKTKPYEGIPEMLDIVAGRGLKMAVLSNKPHEFTKKCVTEFLSKWAFDEVIGQRDSVPNKPDPGAAREIAETFNISPSEFLYLGDTPIDMKTALAAGMYPVGALWGFRSAEELKKSGAKKLLSKPQDILKLLS